MTHRRAFWTAAVGSLLIQAWFVGLWWWGSGSCFCSAGAGRPVSDAAMALFGIAMYPLEHVLPRWVAGYHPVTMAAANFHVWFAAFYLPLRAWVMLRGQRRPVAGDA
jgi:hypothetical protein